MKKESRPAAPSQAEIENPGSGPRRPFIWLFIVLAGVLLVLFHNSLRPGFVLFSNDGPLGAMVQELNRMPSALKGLWVDLNWLGGEAPAPPASISSLLRILCSPYVYEKILCPTAIFMAGVGACFCFRRMRLSRWACVIGALAAALNSDFFSTSCWGVSTQVIGFGAMFAALGFLAEPDGRWSWIRLLLAGMAVGVGVMEAYDIGALFSLFVAAYVVYQTLFLRAKTESAPAKIGRTVARGFLLAMFAVLIATHTIAVLWGTQIKGIAGAEQDPQIRNAEWAQKTYWSVPKAEILQVFVPGVFGYRQIWHMYESDQPKDNQYWGTIGAGGAGFRLIGTGFYAGVPVVLIALWAILQSLRTRGSPFTIFQRRAVWFWGVALLMSALLAFGKNAPFYQFIYAIPYASTIRNPQKFMHVFSWIMVILFAYGVHGLTVAYLAPKAAANGGWLKGFKIWRANASRFERWWFNGCLIAVLLSAIGWIVYSAADNRLLAYIKTVGIDEAAAPGVARYSLHAAGWFVILLVASVVLMALICSGQFTGARARWGGLLLAILVTADLCRADAPWIVYWDANYKYASDPIINFLAKDPYEHRVSMLSPQFYIPIVNNQVTSHPEEAQAWNTQLSLLQNAYFSAWKQNLFPYHNIECIDDIQEPRVSRDKVALQDALPPNSGFNILRWWVLSNTRYILGPGPSVVKAMDPSGKKLVVVKSYDFEPKRPDPDPSAAADWVSVEKPNGHLSVIDFADALPRAKLYSQWQVSTNDESALSTLANPAFDPQQSVVVSAPMTPPNPAYAGKDPGEVTVNPGYRSKWVELDANVKVPSILFLADRFNEKWHAEVDGKPAPILRADFIMRGVYLEPGRHVVVMRYQPDVGTLWVSCAVVALGLALWGFVAFNRPEAGDESPRTIASGENKKA